MTAIDINAEVLRQLSIISNNKSYLEKTLDFLKGLTSQKGSQTVRGAAYQKMLKSLPDYQEYERGWDDDDALPLYAAVVRNFKKVMDQSTDYALDGWTIFPEANGTLLMEYQKKEAGINLGISDFSYYIIDNNQVSGEVFRRVHLSPEVSSRWH